MANDKLEIEILDDGSLRVTTGSVSGANHMLAEKLLGWLEDQLGGEQERKKRVVGDHTHAHTHHKTVKA